MGAIVAAGIETLALVVIGVFVAYSASKSEKCGTKKLQVGIAASSFGLALLMMILMIVAL